MKHSEVFVFGKDAAEVNMLPGISRKTLAYSEQFMICYVKLAKGAQLPSHSHVHEQSSTIISGSVRYTVGDETRIVGAGDSVLLASNVPHSIIVEEDSYVIDVFTPLREEYL
jgi:quercetin dioxygenase-like cupin family protein